MASTGSNYQFLVEPDSNLKCCICLDVACKPQQHGDSGCGKIFCKECIAKNKGKPCPLCRAKTPKYFEDVRSKCKQDWRVWSEILLFSP